MTKQREKIFGIVVWVFFTFFLANLSEYFLAGISYLKKVDGRVGKVTHSTWFGRRNRTYARTTIELKGSDKKYKISSLADDGGYVDVNPGDSIRLYVRRWHQLLYQYEFNTNVYYVEKEGRLVYNNLDAWSRLAFSGMCFFGIGFLILSLVYLDVVKNISLTNLFFKNKREQIFGDDPDNHRNN